MKSAGDSVLTEISTWQLPLSSYTGNFCFLGFLSEDLKIKCRLITLKIEQAEVNNC